MKRDHFAVAAVLLLLAACGGRARQAPLVAEGPDPETTILTCNLERVKEFAANNPQFAGEKPAGRYDYPLTLAIRASRVCGPEIAKYLLESNPKLNAVQLNEALYGAAMEGNEELVALLLHAGADPNAKNRWDRTILEDAVFAKHLNTARQLVRAGAREDIFSAAALGDARVLRDLLNRDKSLADTPNRLGDLPIDLARRFRQKESSRVLIAYMNDPELPAIITAGDERRTADYLDHHPIAIRMPDGRGWYALHYAIDSGELGIAKLLLERGADVNAGAPAPYNTALWTAVRQHDVAAVKFLLDHHARVDVNVYRIAGTQHDSEIAELLHSRLP